MLGRYDEALEDFNRAIEIDPEDCEALCNKGEALRQLGRHAQALECFEAAIRLDPGHQRARNGRLLALREARENEELKAS
jgi:tetratricopeptide (TPR) repeat protein